MLTEMTDKGMWINFPDGQRIEVEYFPDDDKLRVSHYNAGSDEISAWADVTPEKAEDHRRLDNGIFRPYGVILYDEKNPDQNDVWRAVYFSYDVVTLKSIVERSVNKPNRDEVISACVHCSRLLDVVCR